MRKDWLLLTPLARLGDLGLLLLRWVTGAFLVWQSHDNIFSAARMQEFEKFLVQFDFPLPELMAPLCVWAQLLCGLAFILGLLTRWAGLVTAGGVEHWERGPKAEIARRLAGRIAAALEA